MTTETTQTNMDTAPQTSGKKLKGVVVSAKTHNTAVVLVDRYVKEPKYLKFIKKQKRYTAHNPENQYREGDTVMIAEGRPISKTKKFSIIEKV